MPTLAAEGYEVASGVLDIDTCEKLSLRLPQTRTGTRSLLKVRAFRELAQSLRHQPKLRGALQSLVAVQSILFSKFRDKNWSVQPHRDTIIPMAGRGPWPSAGKKEGLSYVQAPQAFLNQCVAVRLSLDGSPEGDLSVAPGSHIHERDARWSGLVRVVVPRGGALLLRPSVIHGSRKLVSVARRRVIHFLFAPKELPFEYVWHHAH